jgi:hypothetical protein
MVISYNVLFCVTISRSDYCQYRTKSYLSAVYNEWDPYDNLSGGQPDLLDSICAVHIGASEAGWPGWQSFMWERLVVNWILEKVFVIILLPCHLMIYIQIFFLDSCLSSFL